MELLNDLQKQVARLWKAMTPGARVTSALLLAVVIASLTFLLHKQQDQQQIDLFAGQCFSQAEIPGVLAAFAKAGLKGATIEGNRIRVPRDQEAEYMAALVEGDALPENFGGYLQKAVTSSNFTDIFSSDRHSQISKSAKQQELQLVLRKMRGIEDASVQCSEQDEREGIGHRKIIKAAVSLIAKRGQPVDEALVPTVRHLVASAIGCDPANVTVIDLNSGSSYTGQEISASPANPDRVRAVQSPVVPSAALAPAPEVPVQPVVTQPGIVSDPLTEWFVQNWRLVAVFGLGITGWMTWRRLTRSGPVPSTNAMMTANPASDETEMTRRAPRRTHPAPVMRDELSDIVRGDPEVAVGILRTWIGKAS